MHSVNSYTDSDSLSLLNDRVVHEFQNDHDFGRWLDAELQESDNENTFNDRDFEDLSDVFEKTVIPCSKERIVPQENDILQGRERLMRNNPGNVRFRKLIATLFHEYARISSKKAKTLYCQKVIALMDFRFLKSIEVNGVTVWEEMTSEEVHHKVTWSFRNAHKKLRRRLLRRK